MPRPVRRGRGACWATRWPTSAARVARRGISPAATDPWVGARQVRHDGRGTGGAERGGSTLQPRSDRTRRPRCQTPTPMQPRPAATLRSAFHTRKNECRLSPFLPSSAPPGRRRGTGRGRGRVPAAPSRRRGRRAPTRCWECRRTRPRLRFGRFTVRCRGGTIRTCCGARGRRWGRCPPPATPRRPTLPPQERAAGMTRCARRIIGPHDARLRAHAGRARYAAINAAYTILGNPEKRALFDDFGDAEHEGFEVGGGGRAGGGSGGPTVPLATDALGVRAAAAGDGAEGDEGFLHLRHGDPAADDGEL